MKQRQFIATPAGALARLAARRLRGRTTVLRKIQLAAPVALCASATASANAQELQARPGQTVALGVMGASVYYDETGGDFRLVATIDEPLGGIPIRLVANLKLGQGLSISVPAPTGRPVTEVRLTHTQSGLDISYPTATTN
jgi:hypothetical protein